MTTSELQSRLLEFRKQFKFSSKGPLSVALVVTRHAQEMGLPLDPDNLLTKGGGQVLGLGGGAVQGILKQHGISRTLAKEGGRTSRGSMKNMRAYVSFLNELAESGYVDLNAVEDFWIQRVKEFFASKPFNIRLDASHGLRAVIRDVIAQAEHRQREAQGTQYTGAVLQHLIGAKLDCALGVGNFDHNSFSTSDDQTGRAGDFLIGDVAIHVTTTPTEALVQRCQENLNEGYRPVIVTTARGLTAAEVLAENKNIDERVDIFEVEQFVALNLYELGRFAQTGRRIAIDDLVTRYNEIIENYETDPSLKIQYKK